MLHQLWTLREVHEALRIARVGESRLIEQGTKCPASVFIEDQGDYWTCWFELQGIKKAPPSYKRPRVPLFERKVAWKRPNILISRGKHDSSVDAQKFVS